MITFYFRFKFGAYFQSSGNKNVIDMYLTLSQNPQNICPEYSSTNTPVSV